MPRQEIRVDRSRAGAAFATELIQAADALRLASSLLDKVKDKLNNATDGVDYSEILDVCGISNQDDPSAPRIEGSTIYNLVVGSLASLDSGGDLTNLRDRIFPVQG